MAGMHDFLPLSPYVQAILVILLLCICTRVWSGCAFTSTKNSTSTGIQPPTVPYWLPYLCHAFPMATDMKHFAAYCMNTFGNGTPFFIRAANERILFVSHPEHVKKVVQSSSELDPTPFVNQQIMGRLMGSPKEAVDFYNSGHSQADYAQKVQMRMHLTGSSLVAMVKRYFSTLNRNIAQFHKQNSHNDWAEIPDLYSFIEDQLTRAITETLMGSAFLEGYDQMVPDLWEFIENTDNFFKGKPRILMPSAYAARDRLLLHLKKFSQRAEQSRLADDQVIWDPEVGSRLLREREKHFSSLPGHGEDGRASQELGLIYGGTSLTVPVTFWELFETLKDEKLRRDVYAELDSHRDANSKAYDFMQLSVRPLLQSLHAETTRYRSSNLVARLTVAPSIALDEKYVIEKGTLVMMSVKCLGQFTESWASARSQTVRKPLEVFWAERFLVSENGKRHRFSSAGLNGCWASFGGGEHLCPGRHFARNIAVTTLAVLISEYECELSDIEMAKKTSPPERDCAFGTVKPTARIAARLRKRQM